MAEGSPEEKQAERLARLRGTEKPRRSARPFLMPVLAAIGGAGAAVWFMTVPPAEDPALRLETSDVTEFPGDLGLDVFTIAPGQDLADQAPEGQVEIVTDPEAAEAAAALREQVTRLEAELQALREVPGAGPSQDHLSELQSRLAALEAEAKARDAAYADLERENTRLETQLETTRMLSGPEQSGVDPEAARLAELEARRAEAEALRHEQIQSPMVAFRGGAGDGGSSQDAERDYGEDEAFLRAGTTKTEATRSQYVANPAHTVVQGTLIEATLQTAINSQLEGNVAAVVSRDVWSMDMANILIPRGSKLFGRYSASVSRGQRRILVAWDRVVTPHGQSVRLAAYGADRVGRSGVPGDVNTHAVQRFAAAGAVSIIGALPALLAAAVEREDGGEISEDTAEQIGQNASDAVAEVMADYLNIPATISVDQGAVVNVVVNNDLEII
jgi:type IV secretion system protein VirB10